MEPNRSGVEPDRSGEGPNRRRRRVRRDAEPEVAVALDPEPGTTVSDTGWIGDVDTGYVSLAERGLRGLVGGGSTLVSPSAGLRARDAARPRDEDLARAEAHLTVVRRHWTPRDTTPPVPR
jgi:hypothetical protein